MAAMGDGDMRMLRSHAIFILLMIGVSSAAVSAVTAEEPNVFLQVESFQCPSVVSPNSTFQVALVVRYGLHGEPNNATIRASIYIGEVNFSSPVWQSDPESVSNGGDKVWNVTLLSPGTEGDYNLTAWAFYLEQGSWQFLNDSINGPSYLQETLRVRKAASLDVDLGKPNVAVAFDNVTVETSRDGNAQLMILVGNNHIISVQPVVELQNSTRLVFSGWSDGINRTQRTVTLHGDMKLSGSYKTQYLLNVNSIIPYYSKSDWYNAGANVSLRVDDSIPMSGLLGSFGARSVFRNWSGDLESNSVSVNVVMDRPKTLDANFAGDYTSLVVPAIVAVGLIGGVVLVALRRRASTPAPEEEAVSTVDERKVCGRCGEPVEKDWTHCIHCGKALGFEEPIQG
jgi:hypothetical protein